MRIPRAATRSEDWGWGPLTVFLSIFWVLAGLFESTWYVTMVSLRGDSPSWGTSILMGQGFWDLSVLFTPLLVRLDRSLSLERGRRLRSVLLHLPALLPSASSTPSSGISGTGRSRAGRSSAASS